MPAPFGLSVQSARGRVAATLAERNPALMARLRRIKRRSPSFPAMPANRRYGNAVGTPVDRVYIERFLERHAADIRGAALEVFSDDYTRRFGGDRVSVADVVDIDRGNRHATIVCDLEGDAHELAAGAYDCFICTQTISITFDHRAVLENARRILKPGGVLLLTVPGISHQADPDGESTPDHWRFTRRAIDRLLRETFGPDAEIEVRSEGTVAAAAAFLYGVPFEELDPAALDPHDPDYEMVVCARVVAAR